MGRARCGAREASCQELKRERLLKRSVGQPFLPVGLDNAFERRKAQQAAAGLLFNGIERPHESVAVRSQYELSFRSAGSPRRFFLLLLLLASFAN
jgi:hypothetical protein